MVIGFLHIGRPEHGVCRYGRLLAAAAQRRADLTVREHAVILSDELERDAQALREAARHVSTAKVVHLQFTEAIWGTDAHRFRNLRTFLRHCHAPVVVTIHDTEPPPVMALHAFEQRLQNVYKQIRQQGRLLCHVVGCLPNYAMSHHEIRHWLMARTAFSVVCTAEEERRLNAPHLRHKIRRIPHFVEARPSLPTRVAARAALGVDDEIVITLLGFIYGGKGYEILLEAAARLARPDVLVVFAGGAIPGNEAYLRQLQERARTLGMAQQLRVTGYLTEDELNRYLVATDIPVCPYEQCYASGALSSWISAKRPILTSDLPQFREYHALSPDAVRLFAPHTPAALAQALYEAMCAEAFRGANAGSVHLCEMLSIERVVDQHVRCYQQCLSW